MPDLIGELIIGTFAAVTASTVGIAGLGTVAGITVGGVALPSIIGGAALLNAMTRARLLRQTPKRTQGIRARSIPPGSPRRQS